MINNEIKQFELITLEAHQLLVCGQLGRAQEVLAEVYQQLITFTKFLPEDKVKFLSIFL